jgi:hypothetical protein
VNNVKVQIRHEYKDYHSRPGGTIEEIYVEDTPEEIIKIIEDGSHSMWHYDEKELQDFLNGVRSYLDGDHTDYFIRVTKEEAIEEAAKEYEYKLESISYNFK